MDWIVHGGIDFQNPNYGFEISSQEGYPDSVRSLAGEILVARNLAGAVELDETSNPELAMLIACGHLIKKYQGGYEEDATQRVWDANPCRYHEHVKLGLPCYKAPQ